MKRTASNNSTALANRLKQGQLHKLKEIAAHLKEQQGAMAATHGVSSGRLGVFLFFYAHARQTGETSYAADAEAIFLESLCSTFSARPMTPVFYRELAETGRLIMYLQNALYLDSTFDTYLSIIDKSLFAALPGMLRDQNFDPFTGYLAPASYFLERAQVATEGRSAVIRCVDALLNTYQKAQEGGFWRSNFLGRKQIYTGWSHGMAAVLLFLTQVLERPLNYKSQEIKQVLKGGATYLCSLAEEHLDYIFPDVVEAKSKGGSLNLCYGDLGICYSIYKTALSLQDRELQHQAHQYIVRAAKRREPQLCNVFDSSLIYGAGGTALLFKQLFQTTGLVELQEAAAYWYSKADALSRHENRVAGFKSTYNQAAPHTHLSLFEGLAGYGLTILEYEIGSIGLLNIIGY